MTDTGVHTVQIRDTAKHNVPTDSEGSGYETSRKKTLVKLDNTHDQDLTVTIRGAMFNNPEMISARLADGQSAQNVTLGASGGWNVFVIDVPWSYLEVEASAATAPTTGNLSVTLQTER